MPKEKAARPFEPMLAAPRGVMSFPAFVQPKYDGIRAVVKDGQLLSRKLEPIPNRRIREYLSNPLFNGADGELIFGDPTDKDVYHKTESVVMSEDKDPEGVIYYVFDDFTNPTFGYSYRFQSVQNRFARYRVVQPVPSYVVNNEVELMEFEERFANDGYEGSMFRGYNGLYKYGRATEKEGTLWKMKRFEDDEMLVTGVEEKMHNANEDVRSATGKAKRGHAAAGKVPTGLLGALVGSSPKWPGQELRIGSSNLPKLGIDYAREFFVGKLVTFKHQPAGAKNKPRFPIYKGIRHPGDLS